MPVDGMMVGVSRGHGAVVLLVVGGVLDAVPSVAGCAGGQSGATGEIVGGVYQVGGPMALDGTTPRSPLPGTVTATATDGRSGAIYRVRTADDGTFALHVEPGVDELAARTDSGGQLQPVEVTVAAGAAASIELDAFVP